MEQPQKRRSVQSVDRAFDLLECLADAGGPLGLSQLAASTGLPLPTVHRILRSLTSSGHVRQDSSRRYTLGARLIRLGDVAIHGVRGWAAPHLSRLVQETGESASMAMLEGDAAVYVAQASSSYALRTVTEVGRQDMPYCTAVGKVLLSRLSEDEVHQILRRTGFPTPSGYTTTKGLLGELHRVRAEGYAVDDGVQELGLLCVAVPVNGAPRNAAFSVSGPSDRLTPGRVPCVVRVLQRAAKDLSYELGRLVDYSRRS